MTTNKRYYWIKLKEDIVLNESNPCPTRDRDRERERGGDRKDLTFLV